MPVTLDIGATRIKLLSVKAGKVETWTTVPLPEGAVKNGDIIKPRVVSEAINALFKSLHLPKNDVIITLSGLPFTYRILTLPLLKHQNMLNVVLKVARKEIPLPPNESYIYWQITDTKKDEFEVFLVGVSSSLVDSLVQTLKLAGVSLSGIDLKALALTRAVSKVEAILINFETDGFDIIIVINGIPVILHSVTTGETASTEDKTQQLINELTRTVDYYNITHPSNPLIKDIPLILTGEMITFTTVVESIRDNTGYHIEFITPKLIFPADFPISSYTSNIGLALIDKRKLFARRESQVNHINLNLLTGKHQSAEQARLASKKSRYAILTIFIVLLLFLTIMKNQVQQETARQNSEIEILNRALLLARTQADNDAEIEKEINLLQSEINDINKTQQTVLGKDINDADTLQFITNISVLQSFTSIKIIPAQVIIEGQANSAEDIINYATALESGNFSEVRIGKIEQVSDKESGYPLSFSVIISR